MAPARTHSEAESFADSHCGGDSGDQAQVMRHMVDAYMHRDPLRQSYPGENWIDGRKPLLVWLSICDVDSSRDTGDMPANSLLIAHQLDCCRIAFANRPELGFLEIGVHPERIRIDKRDFALPYICKVVALSQQIRYPSVNRGSDLGALEIDARLT